MFRGEGWREEEYYGRVFQVEAAACMKCPREEGAAGCWRMDAGAGFQPPLSPTARDPCAGYNLYTYAVTWVLYVMVNSCFLILCDLCFISCQLTTAFLLKHFLPLVSMTPHSSHLPFTYASPSSSVGLHAMACPRV